MRVGVQPAAGSDDINLAELTIQYVSDNNFSNLVVGNDSATGDVQATGDTAPGDVALTNTSDANYLINVITAENDDVVMTDSTDRYEIVIPLAEEAVDNTNDIDGGNTFDQGELSDLPEGSSVELTITTDVGSQTVAVLQVPDSLSGDDAGSTVNL